MPFDWHEFHATEHDPPALVDSRRRMRIALAGFVLALAVVFGRVVQLEMTEGAAYRADSARPLRRQTSLPGVRGRILACDGTVLACDKEFLALAVQYRLLQQPPDEHWLRQKARRRLSKAGRKAPGRLAAEMAKVTAERDGLIQRLQHVCGLSPEAWNRRARRIQARVERIAESVRRRRGSEIVVAEELEHHVVADDLPPAAVAELEASAEQYAGAKVVTRKRRTYPSGSLAAHLLGHLGPVGKAELEDEQAGYHAWDFVGRAGLERQYESLLRGRRGTAVELTDRTGRVLSAFNEPEPGVGRDLVLTIEPRLQQAAAALLDAALERRTIQAGEAPPAGGAVVVMDVQTGALRAAASAPRFDPNVFVAGESPQRVALLEDEARPLLDRTCRMALPPGSVFKIVSAVALVESATVEPEEPFHCQGYLHHADRQRCAIYRRRGIGHGDVTLADALCVSCNVYFFHHCTEMGPQPLVDWALKFGFARPTGVDLPGEAAGMVPTPATIRALEDHAWRPGDTQLLCIGQGSLTATPLQVACLMAAVGSGGELVRPHVVQGVGRGQLLGDESPSPRGPWEAVRISAALAVIREGLERVVADPQGTAHGTVHLDGVAIAGKTGTAQCGEGRADHAWFAGYVPAEEPKLALVVVLEHAGDAATAAGPVARRLVVRMRELGML